MSFVPRRRPARSIHLVVDPIACDGHGVCAELFPERIGRDPWGFPVIDPAGVPGGLLEHAQRAVDACPRLALHLVSRDAGEDAAPGPRAVSGGAAGRRLARGAAPTP